MTISHGSKFKSRKTKLLDLGQKTASTTPNRSARQKVLDRARAKRARKARAKKRRAA